MTALEVSCPVRQNLKASLIPRLCDDNGTCVTAIPGSFLLQSFNAPTQSKMRLWTCAAIAFMFCGTALFDIFTRTTIPTGPERLHSRAVHSPQRQPSPSTFRAAGHQRSRRAPDDLESILVECKTPSITQFLVHSRLLLRQAMPVLQLGLSDLEEAFSFLETIPQQIMAQQAAFCLKILPHGGFTKGRTETDRLKEIIL